MIRARLHRFKTWDVILAINCCEVGSSGGAWVAVELHAEEGRGVVRREPGAGGYPFDDRHEDERGAGTG
jgi:hypothetical protein